MAESMPLLRSQQLALEWATRARTEGWLSAQDVASIETLDERSPEMLFEEKDDRPLVVAFFGGTGVGKSTLLNRLARQEVARTGAVRPTSREISVYLHESVRLRPMPDMLPMDKVRIALHSNEGYRHVFWVDMPDFDSTDRSNHQLALHWLPHIDVVIYVVSPERYRDDRGWRLLLDHEQEHAWMFVMNQWDRGHPLQLGDFEKLLRLGGFVDPVILRTDSRSERSPAAVDDFERLEQIIRELSERRAMEQLTKHNREARRRLVDDAVAALVAKLGDDAAHRRLGETWQNLWAETSAKLLRGLQWPVQELAARFVQRDGNLLQRSLDLNRTAQPSAAEAPAISLLWDEWAQLCFEDSLDRLLVECDSLGLPAAPFTASLGDLRASASRLVLDRAQTALRESLVRPGSWAQRLWLKLSGLIAVVAPLLAIGWVSYEVVIEYYQSVHEEVPFLGTNFAIHSGLLIAVSWLLPYFVHRKLRPSTERTARQGLQAGLRAALDELCAGVSERLKSCSDHAASLRATGLHLIGGVESPVPSQGAVAPNEVDVLRFLAKMRS